MRDDNRTKLEALAKIEGYEDVDALLEAAATDSVSPGICMDCGHSTEVELDQDSGWCENCDRNSVKSALILAGLI